MNYKTWALTLPILLAVAAVPARGVVVVTGTDGNYSVTQIYTTDAAYTTSSYAGSGDQYEGAWQVGGGTAIAPYWFLSATHINPPTDANGVPTSPQSFVFNNSSYQVVKGVDVGNGMTAWEVNRPFSVYAPIFANNDPSLQPGAHSVQGATTSDFGYGVAAGVRTDNPAFSTTPVTGPDGLQGYQWGGRAGGLSWGASSVYTYFTDPSGGDLYGTTYLGGAFLPSLGTGTMSSTLTLDDSGGGLFALVNGKWQLVGVNLGTDNATYSPNPDGSGALPYSSLFDQNGFYVQAGNGQWVPASPSAPVPGNDNPQFWLADAITPDVYANILATVSVPEPAALPLLLAGLGAAGAARLRGRLRRRRPAP